MRFSTQSLSLTTPPISQSFVAFVDRKTYPPVRPNQILEAAVASVESTLSAIRSGIWPRDVPFPHIFVVSTIYRDSWAEPKELLVFHDEGAQDIAVSTAEAINFPSRQSASFPTFLFMAEQLVAQDRADIAILLLRRLFPLNGPSHPIFSNPDTTPWRQFIGEECQFELHPPAKGFAGVLLHSNREVQFQSVGRIIILAHELGHYLASLPEAEKILVKLKVPSDVLQDHEASADLIGVVLAVGALSRSVDFRQPGAMTWLVAKANLLLQIHHAFVEVRRMTMKVIGLKPSPELGNRAKLVSRELADPDTVRSVFRLGGSRAKVIEETLAHHQKYVSIVVSSILQSASVMVESIVEARTIVNPPGASANRRNSDDEPDHQAVLQVVRNALGDDIFRVLSVHSNQAPGNWSEPHRLADGQNLDLWGQRSVGMKALQLTNGILLDVSDWRLERAW
ncbi:hypothetical protein EDE15_4023 [Edaphobacter aggregans]|uniref:Uncharacterized protein n=1 Tax=Edaphobacter aggregans TaxID=570835 RepID=A0A428MNL9_9BACT|nr:hypothetical protein [Edaphobacter aggregans]RSL18450.1 hypothetical protein EDE15_4023 [Edaphobacter aggregans]